MIDNPDLELWELVTELGVLYALLDVFWAASRAVPLAADDAA